MTVQDKSADGRTKLVVDCAVCEDNQIVAEDDDRKECVREIVQRVRKHLKKAHGKNPDEYDLFFDDWFEPSRWPD